MKKLILIFLLAHMLLSNMTMGQITTTFKYTNSWHDDFNVMEYDNFKMSRKTFVEKYKLKDGEFKSESIILSEEYLMNTSDGKYKLLKYRELEGNVTQKSRVIYIKNDNLIKKKGEVPQIVITLSKITLEALMQFRSSFNNPTYPEINKLKQYVKDIDGTLSIYKLEQVIKQHKAELAKYLYE